MEFTIKLPDFGLMIVSVLEGAITYQRTENKNSNVICVISQLITLSLETDIR
jgi:hypothetical protein